MSSVTGANPNMSTTSSVKASGLGDFTVNGQKMTAQDLMLLMTLNSLNAQDAVFESLFKECEERTKQLNSISTCMQILGKYKDCFDKDGKCIKNQNNGSTRWVLLTAEDQKAWKDAGGDQLRTSGMVPGLESMSDYSIDKPELDTMMENLKLAQGQISSVNEQQMMRANQAANKRATVLQFGQSLLQSIKEAMQASAR